MGRGKAARTFEPIATPLQDTITVDFQVVGHKEWLDTAFEPGAVLPHERFEVTNPRRDLEPILAEMFLMKLLGIDTETTGRYIKGDKGYSMNPINEDTRMVLLQIGNEKKVWLIQPELAAFFKEILESDKILHLLHNALYDFKWLLVKYGIHMLRIYCSMLAEQALRAGLMGMKVGLADCARRYEPFYLVSKAVRSHFIHLNNGRMSRQMVVYAVRDIPLLFPVFRAQVKSLDALKLKDTAQLEFDCIPCTAEMEIGGVFLHQQKLELLIKYWTQRQLEMEQEILALYSERMKQQGRESNFIIPELSDVFDLGSTAKKLEALRLLGFKLDDVKRSTLLAIDDPMAKMLGEYSNVQKMTSTYGESLKAKVNSFSGMWHPRFAQMGSGVSEGDSQGRDSKETTATGRYVSDAQQFPRKSDGRYGKELDPDVAAEVCAHFAGLIAQAETAQEALAA